LESTKPLQPFSFFKNIVHHPQSHSEEDVKAILAHEKVHSRQYHSADILAIHLFSIFQWCNPFIYLYKFYLKENLEFIADANTISAAIQKETYQLLLVKSTMGEKYFPFVNQFFNSSTRLTGVVKKFFFGESFGHVKKRIVMLNKKKSKKRNSIKYASVVPLLIGFVLLFNVETVAKVRMPSPSKISVNQDQESIDPKVYSITKETLDLGIEALKLRIKTENGELSIENLKRNSEGQIISISVTLKVSEFGSVTKRFNGENGIKTIFFGQNDSGGHSFMRNEKDTAKLKSETTRKPPKIDFDKADVYSIHKNTSDKEIKQIKAAIEKKGREFSYTHKRNSKGEIIDLELEIRIPTGGSGHFKSEPPFEICYFGFFEERGVFIGGDEKAFNELKKRNTKDSKGLGSNLREAKNEKFNEVVYDKEKTGDFPPLTVFNYRPRGFVLQQRWPIGETTLKSVIAASKEKMKNEKFNEVTYDKEKSGDFPHGIGFNYPYSGPLYLVNGVETPYKTISTISPEIIESINVLKGKQSISIYGEKGKNGVIQIKTRDTLFRSPTNLNIDAFISEYGTKANQGAKNNDFSKSISKTTTEIQLKKIQKEMLNNDLRVAFQKVERNQNGEIVSIIISVTDELTKKKSTASFHLGRKPIPNILVGRINNQATATSSY